jgi:uracil DNA glycosylase
MFEETALQEVRVVLVGHDPFAHRLRESALDTDVVPRAIDPVAQPGPLGEQRLV